MSVSAAQAEAFYEEVLRAGQVWAIGDEGGCAPTRTAWHERSGRAELVGPGGCGAQSRGPATRLIARESACDCDAPGSRPSRARLSETLMAVHPAKPEARP